MYDIIRYIIYHIIYTFYDITSDISYDFTGRRG